MTVSHVFFRNFFESDQLKRRNKVTEIFSDADLLVMDDLFPRKSIPKQAAKHI